MWGFEVLTNKEKISVGRGRMGRFCWKDCGRKILEGRF
jgi:hypothetical protein